MTTTTTTTAAVDVTAATANGSRARRRHRRKLPWGGAAAAASSFSSSSSSSPPPAPLSNPGSDDAAPRKYLYSPGLDKGSSEASTATTASLSSPSSCGSDDDDKDASTLGSLCSFFPSSEGGSSVGCLGSIQDEEEDEPSGPECSSRSRRVGGDEGAAPRFRIPGRRMPDGSMRVQVADCYPGTPPALAWWEEVLMFPLFFILCAPMTSWFALDFLCIALGKWQWHLNLWYAFFVYWVLLFFNLIPRFKAPQLALLRSWFLKAIVRYFDATTILEDADSLRFDKPYIVTSCPHSTFPLATVCAAFFGPHLFPRRQAVCLVASAMQLLLVFWQYMEALGSRPISPQNIKAHVDKGSIVNIVVGGIAEMFLLDDDKEMVLIRRGFIREAIRNGVEIVPSYIFHHTKIWRNALPDWLHRPIATFCRKTGLPFAVFYGRGFLFVPFKVPMSCALGRPIPVQKMEEPTEAYVEEILIEYKASLTRLYYTYRPEEETRDLHMIERYPWEEASA